MVAHHRKTLFSNPCLTLPVCFGSFIIPAIIFANISVLLLTLCYSDIVNHYQASSIICTWLIKVNCLIHCFCSSCYSNLYVWVHQEHKLLCSHASIIVYAHILTHTVWYCKQCSYSPTLPNCILLTNASLTKFHYLLPKVHIREYCLWWWDSDHFHCFWRCWHS